MPAHPDAGMSQEQKLAAALEGVFARHGRSLTDQDTVTDFLITLGEVRKLLNGALAQGLLDGDQHGVLDGMVEGMTRAPGLLAPPHA